MDRVVAAYREAVERGVTAPLISMLHPDVVLTTSSVGRLAGVADVSRWFESRVRDPRIATSVGDSYIDGDVIVITITCSHLADGDEDEYAVAFFLGRDGRITSIIVDV
ncbi:MAG: nuclear transport factor 2 family protein [Microbacterium sp.]|uniref:nuclear transport factor 2 family protein n=1 Tax=Microbacterium sp. TaxID=51671 RepID=UPI0039E36A9B